MVLSGKPTLDSVFDSVAHAEEAHPGASRHVSYLTFRRQIIVEWGHCDPAGMVFNSRFFEFFDETAWLLFQHALGVAPAKITETFGVTMPLVDARGRFVLPA